MKYSKIEFAENIDATILRRRVSIDRLASVSFGIGRTLSIG
jgi:hypothetical protein